MHLPYYSIQPSLPTHLWILSNVLMEGARNRDQADFRGNLAEHLFKYTAAMSCRKILRRITNKRVSHPYIESLKKVGISTGNPGVLPSQPVPQPAKTRTRIYGSGFWPGWGTGFGGLIEIVTGPGFHWGPGTGWVFQTPAKPVPRDYQG